MKFPRRRPTDHDLMSWLTTGKPQRVDKMIDDADVSGRLDRLTELSPEEVEALRSAVAPARGFATRTEAGVQQRVSDIERATTLLGLLGLGAQTARSLAAEDRPPSNGRGSRDI